MVAGWAAGQRQQLLVRQAGFVDQALAAAHIGRASLGQVQPAGIAVDQAQADRAFQFVDAARQRRRGHVQRARRQAEALALGNLYEQGDVIELDGRSFHRHSGFGRPSLRHSRARPNA
ncbi:hypothetical protein G6F22_020997 [Rhizopus arrhizus]|nr:hypothetical protein G6F22_020997 [Rhizopus arrhizus]